MLDLIKERRSVRAYTEEKISTENILKIIEAGTWAPTGCNNQELRYYVLDTEEEIAGMAAFKPLVKTASHVILLFINMDLHGSKEIYAGAANTKNLPFIDAGLSLGNMCLYAKSTGIDSCIFNMTPYHMKKRVKRNMVQKINNKLLKLLGLSKLNSASFQYYQINELKLPERYKACCGLALGYGKVIPNVSKFVHGYNSVQRKKVHEYILSKNIQP